MHNISLATLQSDPFNSNCKRGRDSKETSGSRAAQIAMGMRDKCVQVWSFDSSSRKLELVHSNTFSQDKDIVLKSLAFDHSEKRDLCVFSLYDGAMSVILSIPIVLQRINSHCTAISMMERTGIGYQPTSLVQRYKCFI